MLHQHDLQLARAAGFAPNRGTNVLMLYVSSFMCPQLHAVCLQFGLGDIHSEVLGVHWRSARWAGAVPDILPHLRIAV
eukprot:SAG31_NODE_6316_length_2068_cov_1.763332_1_plen_78_part_00